MTQPDRLQRAVARLILRHPFLATLALRLERIEDPTAGTAWTDGVRLAVDPAWFAQLDDDLRVVVVAHECYHVALAHHLRRGGRDLARWNVACDYAVNALLQADGFVLPPGALLDPRFGDACAEAIYHQLPPEPDDPEADASAFPPAAGNGSSTVSPPAPGGTAIPPPPTATRAAPPAAGASLAPGIATPTPPAGSGAGPSSPPPGTSEPQPPHHRPETFGQVRDQPTPVPPTPAQQEARLAEHAVLITALAQQARAAGKDSLGARRAATAARQPATIDWRALLAEFLTARHEQDYTWRRPNPRYALLGLFLPLLEAAAPGRIAFVVDTSGSVPKSALDAVTAELESYLHQYPTITLDVLYADAEVTGSASFTAADLPLRLEPIGGGGTDFRPALAALADADDPPACIVYLTDLHGRFPDEPPPIPIIWLVFGQPLAAPAVPFGKMVLLPY
ncbi:MAG TPA: VWA-like domain-containing protein [Thermoanaerobaculia bacterium]|nr:VWA-like domain-containing protein [Thermoanaerobaculia bacterium]